MSRTGVIQRFPTLVAAAHGTRSTAGQRQLEALIDVVRCRRPDLNARLCYVDVIEPSLADVMDQLRGPVVVIPVLLSTGYHVRQDIPSVVAGRAAIARHLGPDPLLTDVVATRLEQAHALPADLVALVASGSSEPDASADLDAAAADLERRIGVPFEVVTISDALPGELSGLASGRRLAIASYLLAEGHFAETVRTAAPPRTVVTGPLGPDPAVADLILRRFDEVALR